MSTKINKEKPSNNHKKEENECAQDEIKWDILRKKRLFVLLLYSS